MPDISIGRQGWLAIGLEDTPGTAVESEKFIPFDSCDLSSQIEILNDESAKGVREASWGSTVQQHSGGGDIETKTDVEIGPYLLIPALGDYTSEEITLFDEGTAYRHIIGRKASNPPQTATFYFNNTVEVRQFTYSTFENLEISFSDEWATLSGTIISRQPTTITDADDNYPGAPSYTDDKAFSFKDARIYFVNDVTDDDQLIEDNEAKVSDFNFTMNNNSEAQYLSGSSSPAEISLGEFSAEGDYTIFFDSPEEREKLESQAKRGMVVVFEGDQIGNLDDDGTEGDPVYEEIRLKIPSFNVTTRSIDTSPSDFVTENPEFTANYDESVGSLQVEIVNKHADYLSTTS